MGLPWDDDDFILVTGLEKKCDKASLFKVATTGTERQNGFAISALARLGEWNALLKLFQGTQYPAHARAMVLRGHLIYHKDIPKQPLLLAAFQDPEPRLRAVATIELGSPRTQEALERLLA